MERFPTAEVWVGVSQSPEDFDSASLEEEQGLAGSGQA